MTRQMTLERHEQEQADLAERSAHAGCLTIAEAARALHLHRQSVRESTIERRGLGHKTPWDDSLTGAWHLTVAELRYAYPHLVARQPRTRLTAAEHAQAGIPPATPRPGTPEHRAFLKEAVTRIEA